MKKRISAMAALALALTMLFSLTALAAPSTSATNSAVTTKVMTEYAQSVTVVSATGTPVEVKAAGVLAYDAAVNAAASLVSAPAGQSAVVKTVFEAKAPKATAEEWAAGITLTFTVPGYRPGANYALLHMLADKTWEVIPTTVNADGTVSGVFHSLSPVAIVEVAAGSAASPKTADGSAMPYALAMIALCGMAFISYRKAAI